LATIYDLFEVTGISEHTTYSTAAGNLIGLVDSMSSADLDDGDFDEGDTILIGGVTYTIDQIQEPQSSGRFTQGDGVERAFDPGSESNLDVVFLTVSNGGDTRHFVIPNDSYGDMNVQQIRTGEIRDVAGSDAAIISTVDNALNVVCFAAGTLIETPNGDVPVETLEVGDLVCTRDHGAQQVRTRLVRDVDFRVSPDRLKPIQFEKNALGSGRPNRRLCVSPQHRMLVTCQSGEVVLVPAKALTGRKGVRVMRNKRRVTYHHLVFGRHEIIRANGTLTESFLPGRMAFAALPADAQTELRDVFGAETVDQIDQDGKAAMPILRVQEAKRRALSFV